MSEGTWRRNPRVVARRIGDETILVPTGRDILDAGSLFTLNDTASFIWDALERPRTPSEIHSALTDAFDVTPERAREDVERFLSALAGAGCIVEEP